MGEAADVKAMPPSSEKNKEQSVAFYKLFCFADRYDYLLMIFGSLGAVVHGSSMPVFFLLFGEMVNGFGKNQMDLHKMTHEVAKVCLLVILSSHNFHFQFYPDLTPHSLSLSLSLSQMQYALYFVCLGLVVCFSSYAGGNASFFFCVCLCVHVFKNL